MLFVCIGFQGCLVCIWQLSHRALFLQIHGDAGEHCLSSLSDISRSWCFVLFFSISIRAKLCNRQAGSFPVLFAYPSFSFIPFLLFSAFTQMLPLSSLYSVPLSIFCSAALVVINYLSLQLCWNALPSPSILKDSFFGHISLGWQLYTFRAWNTVFHTLLAFRMMIQWYRSYIVFAFAVSWCFPLATFLKKII